MSSAAPVPFFRPSTDGADEARVLECIRSGWLTTGVFCAALEAAVRDATGARFAASFASATAALHCALAYRLQRARSSTPGVVVPTYTFAATATAIIHAGGRPVLCDVEEADLCISAAAAAHVCDPGVAGVCAVDFAGLPFDRDAMRSACEKRGLFLVEDAAHSLGARGALGPIGARGDVCFSFYANKGITTAEGGMLCTEDAGLDSFARRFRIHGISGTVRDGTYDIDQIGYKYNLPDLCAALGVGQVRRLAALTAARRALAARYDARLAGLPVARPAGGAGHAWHLYVIRTERRDALAKFLAARGIGYSVHYKPLHRLAAFRRPDRDFPVASRAADCSLSLPIFPGMAREEQDRVIAALWEFFT
jgi:dTDP-4-amino-4,6-dideoxygalactose transaminase